MHLKYRYTAPPVVDGAQMDISLNNQFLQSVPLNDHAQRLVLRLPLLQELLDDHPEVPASALKPGKLIVCILTLSLKMHCQNRQIRAV